MQNLYNVKIPVSDQEEAVINIKKARSQIAANNDLFARNKSNYESKFYPHNAYTNIQIKKLFGDIPSSPSVSSHKVDLTLKTKNNQTVQIPTVKSKRAVNNDPRCQNLPAYKNWVEEGKTAPVQDQGQCCT